MRKKVIAVLRRAAAKDVRLLRVAARRDALATRRPLTWRNAGIVIVLVIASFVVWHLPENYRVLGPVINLATALFMVALYVWVRFRTRRAYRIYGERKAEGIPYGPDHSFDGGCDLIGEGIVYDEEGQPRGRVRIYDSEWGDLAQWERFTEEQNGNASPPSRLAI